MKVNFFKNVLSQLRDKHQVSSPGASEQRQHDHPDFDIEAALCESKNRAALLSKCKDMLDIVKIEGISHLEYFSSESGSAGAASIDGQPVKLDPLWTERAQSVISLIKEGMSLETRTPRCSPPSKVVESFEMDASGVFTLALRSDELYNESQVTIKGQLGDSKNFTREMKFDYSLAQVAASEVRRIGRANYDHVPMTDTQRANLKSRMTM